MLVATSLVAIIPSVILHNTSSMNITYDQDPGDKAYVKYPGHNPIGTRRILTRVLFM